MIPNWEAHPEQGVHQEGTNRADRLVKYWGLGSRTEELGFRFNQRQKSFAGFFAQLGLARAVA